MERPRIVSMDTEFLMGPSSLTAGAPDQFLSSSFPGASAPPRRRPEPPRAPERKPSSVSWEADVPPLELPLAPSKRTMTEGTIDEATTTYEPSGEDADDDEDEEACVFSLETSGTPQFDDNDDEEGGAAVQYTMSGLDDFGEDLPSEGARVGGASSAYLFGSMPTGKPASGCGATLRARSRSHSGSMSPKLGASPMLLSVLEQVAAEAEIRERPRLASV
mmetsp:Transcript_67385/g.144144  ORF Transcript_67385/g.144144 Transcript_67385/m.144144 type:complete len:219 (+) Transcript_67385:116-772(+)